MISGNVFRVGSANDGTLGGLTPGTAITLTTPHLVVFLSSSIPAYYVGIDSMCLRAAADTYLDVVAFIGTGVTGVTAGTARTWNNMRGTGGVITSLTCTENPTGLTGAITWKRSVYRSIAPAIGTTFRDSERTHYVCLDATNQVAAFHLISATATGTVTWILRADKVR